MIRPLKVLVNLRVAVMKRKSSFMALGWESSQDIEYASLANLAKSRRQRPGRPASSGEPFLPSHGRQGIQGIRRHLFVSGVGSEAHVPCIAGRVGWPAVELGLL